MEGAGGDLLPQPEAAQAAPELAGGLAGEGQGEDVAALGPVGGDPVGDPSGQRPRLARTRARDDEQRPRAMLDRALLFGLRRQDYRKYPAGLESDFPLPGGDLNSGDRPRCELDVAVWCGNLHIEAFW